MTYFNELQEIITNRQLIEVDFNGGNVTNTAGYILAANEEYIALATINNQGLYEGLAVYSMNLIDSIDVETLYLEELTKHLSSGIFEQAMQDLGSTQDLSLDTVLAHYAGKKALVEIYAAGDRSYAGRVVEPREDVIILDQYYNEYDRRYARTFIDPTDITCILVNTPWLRLSTRSLADKNL